VSAVTEQPDAELQAEDTVPVFAGTGWEAFIRAPVFPMTAWESD
jgi:hypothetical protein